VIAKLVYKEVGSVISNSEIGLQRSWLCDEISDSEMV
jgi:hypothetical protein